MHLWSLTPNVSICFRLSPSCPKENDGFWWRQQTWTWVRSLPHKKLIVLQSVCALKAGSPQEFMMRISVLAGLSWCQCRKIWVLFSVSVHVMTLCGVTEFHSFYFRAFWCCLKGCCKVLYFAQHHNCRIYLINQFFYIFILTYAKIITAACINSKPDADC